jgi:hypothetical protein
MAYINFNNLSITNINDEERYIVSNIEYYNNFTQFYHFINNKIIIRITGKGNMGCLSEIEYNNYIKTITSLVNTERSVIIFDGDTYTTESPFTVLIQKLYDIGYPVICVSMYKNNGFNKKFYFWNSIFNKENTILNYNNLVIIDKAPKTLTSILETININIGSYNPKYLWSEQKVTEALHSYFKLNPTACNLFQNKGNILISQLLTSEYNEFYRLTIEQNYKSSTKIIKKDLFRKNFKYPDKHYPNSLDRYKAGLENHQDIYNKKFLDNNASGLIQPTGLQEIEEKNNIINPNVYNEKLELIYSKENNKKSLIEQANNFIIIVYSNLPYKKIN